MITGAEVSSFTVLVTVVDLPAESVATIVIVLLPSVSVRTLEKPPSVPTITLSAEPLLSLTVTLTGLDVVSLVVPVTVHAAWLVTRPSAGDVIDSIGGTVSILKVTDF